MGTNGRTNSKRILGIGATFTTSEGDVYMVRAIGPHRAFCTKTTVSDPQPASVALPLDKCQAMINEAKAFEPALYNLTEAESDGGAIPAEFGDKPEADLASRETLYQALSPSERHYITARWSAGYESHEYAEAFRKRRAMPSKILIGFTLLFCSLWIWSAFGRYREMEEYRFLVSHLRETAKTNVEVMHALTAAERAFAETPDQDREFGNGAPVE